MNMKACKTCGVEKPYSEYYRAPAYQDGHTPRCKACEKVRRQEVKARAVIDGVRGCAKCRTERAAVDFHRSSVNKDGRASWCKQCVNAYGREKQYRKVGTAAYKRERAKFYGISFEEYCAMVDDGLCDICGQPETINHPKTGLPQLLSIDHCHKSGRVRGGLCRRCNTVLGHVKDDPELLLKMVQYLKTRKNGHPMLLDGLSELP